MPKFFSMSLMMFMIIYIYTTVNPLTTAA